MSTDRVAPTLPRNPLHGLPCPDCGHRFDSYAERPCGCPVVELAGMPLADLKALFAREGLSLRRTEAGS